MFIYFPLSLLFHDVDCTFRKTEIFKSGYTTQYPSLLIVNYYEKWDRRPIRLLFWKHTRSSRPFLFIQPEFVIPPEFVYRTDIGHLPLIYSRWCFVVLSTICIRWNWIVWKSTFFFFHSCKGSVQEDSVVGNTAHTMNGFGGKSERDATAWNAR